MDQIPTQLTEQIENPLPPTKGTKTFLIIVIVLVAASVIGAGGYLLGSKYSAPETSEQIVSVPTATPTVPPTANWKTYTNSALGFEINYPPTVKIEKEVNDQNNKLVVFKGENLNFEIMIRKNPGNIILNKYYFMDAPIDGETGLGGQRANVYLFPKGYCDGPSCSSPLVSIVAENGLSIYHISFYGDTELSEEETQIYSTFRFLNETQNTVTPSLTTIKILDTSTWRNQRCGPVSFKIPDTGYGIKCNSDSSALFNATITTKGGFVPSATIKINQFDGESRRQYWIKALGASDDDVAKYMRFQESLFGSVSGLDVFASGGWWQGGYASPILIADGKTIVAIHGGRDFNDQTGKITRWDFTDTIASTVKFTE